jgi:hypothetical protein
MSRFLWGKEKQKKRSKFRNLRKTKLAPAPFPAGKLLPRRILAIRSRKF